MRQNSLRSELYAIILLDPLLDIYKLLRVVKHLRRTTYSRKSCVAFASKIGDSDVM